MKEIKEKITDLLLKSEFSINYYLKFQDILNNSVDKDNDLKNLLKELEENIKNQKSINFFIEIEPGIGGEEAYLWAQDLFNMYCKFLNLKNTNYEFTKKEKQFLISVKKSDLFSTIENEIGIHRVQRVPFTEKMNRLQTSTASVYVYPEIYQDKIEISDLKISITSAKGKGAGGQNVNKRNNMIRIKDEKTQTSLRVDGRLKAQNIQEAKSRILESIQNQIDKSYIEKIKLKREIVKNRDRSNKIRTYNYKDNRITDHRYKITVNQLDKIVNGHLELLFSKFFSG